MPNHQKRMNQLFFEGDSHALGSGSDLIRGLYGSMSMYYNRLWNQKRREKPSEGLINCVAVESRARGDSLVEHLLPRLDDARYPGIFGLDNYKVVSIISIGDSNSLIGRGDAWNDAKPIFEQTCDLLYERLKFLGGQRNVTPIFIHPPEPIMPTDRLVNPATGALWTRERLLCCREILDRRVVRRLGALTIDFPGGLDEPQFMSYDQVHMSPLGYGKVFPGALRLVENCFEREVDEGLLGVCAQHLDSYISLCIGSGLCKPEVAPGV